MRQRVHDLLEQGLANAVETVAPAPKVDKEFRHSKKRLSKFKRGEKGLP